MTPLCVDKLLRHYVDIVQVSRSKSLEVLLKGEVHKAFSLSFSAFCVQLIIDMLDVLQLTTRFLWLIKQNKQSTTGGDFYKLFVFEFNKVLDTGDHLYTYEDL